MYKIVAKIRSEEAVSMLDIKHLSKLNLKQLFF